MSTTTHFFFGEIRKNSTFWLKKKKHLIWSYDAKGPFLLSQLIYMFVSGEHKFECNQCDYKTNLKISYTDHMKKHAGMCLFCTVSWPMRACFSLTESSELYCIYPKYWDTSTHYHTSPKI